MADKPLTSSNVREPTANPTLRDVAALAEVDASLVSRVVNNDRRLVVSEATRERVLAAIETLGYRPNVFARGLRMARTWTIGFALPSLANPVFAEIVEGAQRRAEELGYAVIISSPLDARKLDGGLSRLLAERRFDGLLVASAILDDAEIQRIAAGQTPVVAVNRRVEGLELCVFLDDALGTQIATEHLIALGHKSLAHIGGPLNTDTSLRRRSGFEQAVDAGGATGSVVEGADYQARAGFDATLRLLKEDPTITGIVAASVLTAIGAIRAVRDHGISVPTDVSVIALHDLPLAEFTDPRLTTIAMPLTELGARAVDALVARIEERDPETGVISGDPRLITRGSTSAPPKKTRAS